MASYIFEQMDQADASNLLAGDTLSFQSATLTPADVTVTNSGNGFNVTTITADGKALAFPGVALAGSTIQFATSVFNGLDATLKVGSFAADSLTLAADDDGSRVYAFGDNDSISVSGGGDADIYGGDGNDIVTNSGSGAYNIFGEGGDDFIDGGSSGDHLYGFGLSAGASTDGDDSINGRGGNDYIQGNAGSDTLLGDTGRDRINGGGDNDVIYAGSENDTVNGNKGDDSIFGDTGNDSLRGGQGDDTVNGSDGNDVISGDLGDDHLNGGNDADLINGGDGNDIITGGDGNDVVFGDAGDDVITGGLGLDTLTGGAGNDLFVVATGDAPLDTLTFDDEGNFTAVETINDFASGDDTLDIGFTVGTAGVVTPDDVIFLSAQAAATYAAGQNLAANQVLALTVGDDTYVFYETTATETNPNAVIVLHGVDSVANDDFVVS